MVNTTDETSFSVSSDEFGTNHRRIRAADFGMILSELREIHDQP